MSDKVVVSTKVEKPLKEQFDEYAEDNEMKKSAILRDFIKETVEDGEKSKSTSLPFPIYVAWLGSIAFAAGAFSASDTIAIGGGLIFVTSLIYTFQDEVR